MRNLAGQRVTVMGLGRFGGGVGVARWLAVQGARVRVTDQASAEQLADSLAELRDLPIEYRLDGHDEDDFARADLVVVNPAVPPTSRFLQTARDAGVPITTEINLFVERCAAHATIGVSGSVGKSTTTAMIGHVLERCLPQRRVRVGGNLGRSLLDELPEIAPQDVVVLELSSFQLERTPLVGWSPQVAVLTNLLPNHLDWHGSFDDYIAAKFNLVRFQRPRDAFVIAAECAAEARRRLGADRRLCTVALDARQQPLLSDGVASKAIDGCDVGELPLPGRHNRLNAAFAVAVARSLGVSATSAAAAVTEFRGLPHRLQCVCERDGVRYFDDSKSTTPEATVTALQAFDAEQPILLILGGYDKGIDLSAAVEHAARRCRFVATVGQTGGAIHAQLRQRGVPSGYFERFADAVGACVQRAEPGCVVLLSPACASWGAFRDFRERGKLFERLVQAPGAVATPA